MNKYVQLKKKHDEIINSKEWMTKEFFKAVDDYQKDFNKYIKNRAYIWLSLKMIFAIYMLYYLIFRNLVKK